MAAIRHVLGISGGKDSAALAIYLRNKYPELNIDYYYCDTGKELDETYKLIESLKSYLGKDIETLTSDESLLSGEDPFDFYYKAYRGYLPSSVARWCTKKMKLEPFEKWVGTTPVVSYVGIRGDEDREGYISRKNNIQSIFPFRRNIWSEDVINKALSNANIGHFKSCLSEVVNGARLDKLVKVADSLLVLKDRNYDFNRNAIMDKLSRLFDAGLVETNHALFQFLKTTDLPLAQESDYPLLSNTDVLNQSDIFEILENSGVGVPAYYKKIQYDVDGEKGQYSRTRSGCYFCFFQQKIEWVWLFEQHPDLFKKAMKYENDKEGFTWNQNESLADLTNKDRMNQIKLEHFQKQAKKYSAGSNKLLDILEENDPGCTACFV